MRGHVFVDSKTRYYGLVTMAAKNEYRREEIRRCVLHVYLTFLRRNRWTRLSRENVSSTNASMLDLNSTMQINCLHFLKDNPRFECIQKKSTKLRDFVREIESKNYFSL